MSHKVLVFESDAAFAGELRNELGKLGCSTSVVDDGNLGLQQAASEKPDLILLSIELPRMNGFSVCNKLKKDPSLKDVPLIIMSSESSDETFEQHRKLRTRAEDYVHKPIAFGELLQHIRTFVKLGISEGTPADDAIIIDDEVAVEEIADMSSRPPPHAQTQAESDAEINSFADAAFGRLQVDDAKPRRNGASGGPAATVTDEVQSVHPPEPAPVPRSMGPRSTGVDAAELERARSDADHARARSSELEKELAAARDESSRLRDEAEGKANELEQKFHREIEELKTKLASSGGKAGGGVSSREFLDLREALNKKDKEILSLKEALTKKDKEIYESRDKSLALERAKSDLDDKILAVDREIAEAREKIEMLTADKDNAKKVGEDLKARLGRSQADVEAKTKEIAELKAKGQDEAAAHDAQLARVNEAHA